MADTPLYSFIICSDLHTYYQSHGKGAMKLYQQSIARGDAAAIFCCGDLGPGTSGILNAGSGTVWFPHQTQQIKDICSMNGLLTAGNHDAGNNFGIGFENYGHDSYNPNNLTARQYWQTETGADGNLVSYRYMNNGKDLFLSVSCAPESGNASVKNFTEATISKVIQVVEDNADKRIFLFTHYPYSYTTASGNTTYIRNTYGVDESITIPAHVFAYRYGPGAHEGGKIGNWAAQYYPPITDVPKVPGKSISFYEWLSNHSNIVWFSGHTHNDWRLQEETVIYTANYSNSGVTHTAEYTGGPFKEIHHVRVPNGAYMFNIPSLRYRTQDAWADVYPDRVVVRAREGRYISNHTPVSGYIDSMADDSSWNFEWLSTTQEPESSENKYLYVIPLREGAGGYLATFKADDVIVDVVEFEAGESVLPRVPDVPEKTGYTGVWESYTLTDADITINAIYTANTYHVTFKADEDVVAVVPYQYGTQSIAEPPVPAKEGYVGTWSAYTLGAQDSVSTAIYTPIQPTIHLYNYDGNVISDVYNFNYQQIYSAYNWEGDEING